MVDAITEGVIVVRDDNLDGKSSKEKQKKNDQDRGEANLIALMENDNRKQPIGPVLATDYIHAYRKARERNMKDCNIGQLLPYLCKSTQSA